MNSFVRVYLLEATYALDSRYIYFTLPEQREKLKLGSLVLVPFGNGNRRLLAVVVDFAAESEYKNTKTVIDVVDAPVEIDAFTIELCLFLKSRTFCSFGSALRAVLPRGLSVATEETYASLPAEPGPEGLAGEVYAFLRDADRELTRRELFARFGDESAGALHTLVASGFAEKRVRIVRRQNEKTVRVVYPAIDDAALAEYLDGSRRAGSKKRLELLALLAENGPLTQNELSEYYGVSAQVVAGAAGEGLVTVENRRIARLPYRSAGADPCGKPLTEQQKNALDVLFPLLDTDEPRAALLRGVTGSGKTRVILECVKHTLAAGRTAIVLIPEIGLTAQAVSQYRAAFGENLAVIHSMLSDGERADAYRAARAGDVGVVLGTRSAVFAPLENLGLIAIDEEQEHTYKSEMTPRYHARDIARFRCGRDGALMLLASATPSVESYYKAKKGVYTLVEMDRRATEVELPEVSIVDVREDERVQNRRLIGERLSAELETNAAKGEQSILFVNRRGYNSFLSCQDCGSVVTCPNCSVSLTHHLYSGEYKKNEKLICHYCGYTVQVPHTCEQCGGSHIGFFGFGTQKLQEELERDFPALKPLRMDTDTTAQKFSHDEILKAFASGESDVLYGTQMVAKGLDFPNVSLVGVVNADSMLYMDDFRAGERTFSLITQLIGRAGRAGKRGRAVIQTFNPENEILRKAALQDYVTFYESEVALRRAVLFPPFCDIAVLALSGPDEFALLEFANLLGEESRRLEGEAPHDARVIRLGPFRQAVYKLNGKYRQRIVYKYKDNKASRAFLSELLKRSLKLAPQPVSVEIDVNPAVI